MLKFKNSTSGNKIPYVLHAEQVHDKFLLCFNSSLIPVESYSFFNFIGSLFHKTLLSMKFNEFPYF